MRAGVEKSQVPGNETTPTSHTQTHTQEEETEEDTRKTKRQFSLFRNKAARLKPVKEVNVCVIHTSVLHTSF